MRSQTAVEYQPTSWLDPRVEVRRSVIEGNGLFATAPILGGEAVLVLGGAVVEDDQLAVSQPHRSLKIGEGLHLVPHDTDPARCINHCCDSNLWMEDEVTVTTRRTVTPGEELTLDYALLAADPCWHMTCRCGSTACRQVVTGKDWQLPELQERYGSHFAPFINERIR